MAKVLMHSSGFGGGVGGGGGNYVQVACSIW